MSGPTQRKRLAGSALIRWLAAEVVALIRLGQRARSALIRRSRRYRRAMKSPIPASKGTFVRRTAGHAGASASSLSRHPEAFAIEAQPKTINAATARYRRRMRQRDILLKRRIRARIWKSLRQFESLHRQTPVGKLAVVYVGLAAILVLATGWPAVLFNRPPLGSGIAQKPPDSDPDLLASAAKHLMDKDQALAEQKIQELQRQNPEDPRVQLAIGALEASRKNYDAARAAFEKALAARPGLRAAIFNLAEVEFATGNYAAAEKLYRQVQNTPAAKSDGMMCFRLYLCARFQGNSQAAASLLESDHVSRHSVGWLYTKSAEALLDGDKSTGRRLAEQAKLLYAKESAPYEKTLERLKLLP